MIPASESEAKKCGKKTKKIFKLNAGCFKSLQNVRDYFYDFCDKTSMHGFRFLVETRRTVVEKIWWSLIIIVAINFCVTQTLGTYEKWMSSPVIVTFATEQTPIWQIPFPAVTICPETKTRRALFNYTHVLLKKINKKPITDEESQTFEHLALVCEPGIEYLDNSTDTTNDDAIDCLFQIAPKLDETLFKVKWKGAHYQPSELFTPILTSEGICYSFNILDRTAMFYDFVYQYGDFQSVPAKKPAWVIESGYEKGSTIDSYPRRTLVSGANAGLEIVFLDLIMDLDYACESTMQGYKVILHNSAETPRVKQKYFQVPLDQSVIAAVKPNMMTTSKDLNSYKPSDRHCYLTTERKLKYYKIYNQQNCMVECLANHTLNSCGCVAFYMARDNATEICSSGKTDCVEEAKGSFVEKEINAMVEASRNHEDDSESVCNCKPSCSSLDYDVESSSSDWAWKNYIKIAEKSLFESEDERQILLTQAHFSKLTLLFKDNQFITSERNELYGTVDFWANCGGLLGLFTGFSFVSLFEIFYYFTLRLGCNIRKFGKKNWAGLKEDDAEKSL